MYITELIFYVNVAVWSLILASLGLGLELEIRLKSHLDPEVFMNVSELITSKGYPCEDYTVQTEDGFLLGIQRIPGGRKHRQSKGPVLLQHGLLAASSNWVTNLANESLGFLLADEGYDVWLGNVRGNTYSRKHVKYKPTSRKFWAWSFDEMAMYDLPAMVDFILHKTGQKKLHYVAHSQGSTMAFAKLSHDPEYAKKIGMFFALGPVTTVGHMKSPIRFLAEITPDLKDLFTIFGVYDFLPNSDIIRVLADTFCAAPTRYLCADVIFLIAGFDIKQLNETRLPVYLNHSPAGTSVRNIVHFAQMVRSGLFQRYDYGCAKENMEHYGQKTPPVYEVNNMTVPVVIFWGDCDWLADPEDVKGLIPKLKNLYGSYEIPQWEHLDFIWAMDAPAKVYNTVIKILNKHPL